MLYIPWMVIRDDHGIKKKVPKTSIYELPKVQNCRSRLCTNPLGHVPRAPNTQIKLKTHQYGPKQMRYIPCMVISHDHGIKKIGSENFAF